MKLLVDVSTTGPVTSLSEDVCGGLTCRMFEAMSRQKIMFCLQAEPTTVMMRKIGGVMVGDNFMRGIFEDGSHSSVPWLLHRPPDEVYSSIRQRSCFLSVGSHKLMWFLQIPCARVNDFCDVLGCYLSSVVTRNTHR